MEAKEQIEKGMQKEKKEEENEEEDNNDGELGGEGEKSRKESQPLIVRDAIVEVIVEMFWILFLLCRPGANRKADSHGRPRHCGHLL